LQLVCVDFYNATACAAFYTLSLHDALPFYTPCVWTAAWSRFPTSPSSWPRTASPHDGSGYEQLAGRVHHRYHRGPARRGIRHPRSEEHTSELQSRENLVCRLLLEKKKRNKS